MNEDDSAPVKKREEAWPGPFWPLLTGAEGTVILTGVTVVRGRTLLLAAFGLCLGAIDVSVGPTESVILEKRCGKTMTYVSVDIIDI